MAKVVGLIVTFLLLNTAMFVFTFSGDCPDGNCQMSDYNTEANSTVWAYFTNPSSQGQSSFWNVLFGSTTGLLSILTAGGLIVAGAVWVTKDINIAYLSVAVFLVTAVIGTWVRLWGMVNNSAFILGGRTGGVVVMVLVGILLAVQLMNAIDWGRGVN